MATATSTVSAAVTAIITAINTQPAVTSTAIPPPLVSQGPPGLNQPDDMIIIGERIAQRYIPMTYRGDGGPGWLEEEYTVSVNVWCYRGGDDPVVNGVLARRYALVNAVNDAVRNDPEVKRVYLGEHGHA